MLDLMKKTMLAGIGFAIKSKEEIEDLIKEFVKKGDMEEEEKTSFLKELRHKAEDARKDLEETIENKIKELLKKADIASREEVTQLKNEITELKKKIESGQP
ncbi:MAG TPA: phasin family protein [Desulfatirhabdiaceae bacterium]|jgi:polyhydroxyalkanoate synthesis regulator phasin|nr:phasin family protein [Desulfatirhabdiaceae bacterium]